MESTIEQRVDVENVQQGSNWWSVLGFFIPLLGLILFLVWKTVNPKSAKAAGIGALVSVTLNLLGYVLFVMSNVMI
jgi:hypothetical protein